MDDRFDTVSREILSLLSEMEEQQHSRLLSLARASVPRITADDLKNPDDFRALHHDPRFEYEDGVLSGLRMAAAAIRTTLEQLRRGEGRP